MDFLEYGMKNQNSKSFFRRTIARGALKVAKLQADLYGFYLERKVSLPEEKDDERMLKNILEEVRRNKDA